MPFEFEHLAIPDVILVRAKRFPDDRGFFVETYRRDDFKANGILEIFVQDNHSRSTRGVLRGLHYQRAPRAQGKLIQVIKGEIYDVAVDIRRGSPTYGQWIGIHLSEARSELLYVPPGFAHGFCVLSEVADFTYKCTDIYAPETYRGISWDDPDLDIPGHKIHPFQARSNLPRSKKQTTISFSEDPMSLKHFFRISPTQQHTLLQLSQQHVSAHIHDIETEYCFNVQTDSPLSSDQHNRLIYLLSETFEADRFAEQSFLTGPGTILEVGPRMNFSTAWSTNATAICHACGLTQISRIERSRRYLIKPPEPGSADIFCLSYTTA